MKGKRYLQNGCSGFVAYVLDYREEWKKIVDDVPVVRDYPYVFSKNLHGVPTERQAEFRIDRVLGAAPIAMTLYRLAPLEMQELST